MKLNVEERVVLPGILPQQGDFATMGLMRALQIALIFNDDDIAKAKLEVEKSGNVKWGDVAVTKEIEIGETTKSIVAVVLKKLDDEKALTRNHVTLYAKFVGSGNPDEG